MTQRKRFGSVAKRLRRRAVEFDFDGGRLTSDAGLLLLRQVDSKIGLIDAVNQAMLSTFAYTTRNLRRLIR